MSMQIKNKTVKNTLTFYLTGELDEYAAKMWREKVDEIISDAYGVNKIVYDLASLSFMDSTGIGMLIGRYKKAKTKNICSYIKNTNLTIDKILKLSGLYSVMPQID